MTASDLHEENRHAWNEATAAHNSHKRDQAAFLRDGGSTLFPEEIELLGDVAGLRLLHLQCNAGQDTLSIARLGASVTGVDISDEAIGFARRLSDESGIAATFDRADVYDWLDHALTQPERWDVVFSSYGALIWLSDIRRWARGVAGLLAPNGRLVVVEFHPFMWVFDEEWRLRYPYTSGGSVMTFDEGIGDYVGMAGGALSPSGHEPGVQEFQNPHRSHEWAWGVGDVVTAVLDAGLTLEGLREYPYSNGARPFNRMRELPGRRFVPPEDVPALPMMWSFVARRR